jgi:thiol-activated cytolysin
MGAVRLAILLALASSACQGDDERQRAIDEYIRAAPTLPIAEAGLSFGDAGEPAQDGDFTCASVEVGETRTLDRVVAYAANSEALWPGAIVGGRSVADGLLAQRVFDRAPLTFSVSLESLQGRKSATLEQPRLSNYREALGEILAGELSGATPANLYAEIEEVHSSAQLELALGARASWFSGFGASVAGSFDWATNTVRSRYLVRYIQSYYSVDIDPPDRPSSMFADSVTIDDIRDQMPADDPAAYVSSITYGRVILFTVESDLSSSELRAALEFSFGQAPRIEGEVSLSSEEVLERSRITAYILGGSGELAAQSIDSYEGLRDLVRSGGNYSPDSPGAPIAYRLSYLGDNSPARLSLSQEYTARSCARVNQQVRVTLRGIYVEEAGDDGDELELYGVVWARGSGEAEALFHRKDNELVIINEGETWPPSGPLAEVIVDVTPEAGEVVVTGADLVDQDGLFDADDPLGGSDVEAPFESGWRRDVTLYLSNSEGARVEVLLALQPI